MNLLDVLVSGEFSSMHGGRIAFLAKHLAERHIQCDVARVGRKTVVVVLTESDGWETIGSAAPEHEWKFDLIVGTRWALDDAVQKLTNGKSVAWGRLKDSIGDDDVKREAMCAEAAPRKHREAAF